MRNLIVSGTSQCPVNYISCEDLQVCFIIKQVIATCWSGCYVILKSAKCPVTHSGVNIFIIFIQLPPKHSAMTEESAISAVAASSNPSYADFFSGRT